MSNLYATKTRLALLRDVEAGEVFTDVFGPGAEVYATTEYGGRHKVTARIWEMKDAGWVHLVELSFATRQWQLTDAGRAILTPTYRIVFDRIGRHRDVPPLDAKTTNADDLSEQIYRYARPHLLSRDVNVVVDLKAGKGYIFCGFQTGGTFTIEALPAGVEGHQITGRNGGAR